MAELKPCPFCGSRDFSFSFKRDRRKVLGVYHDICTMSCHGCTASIRQAGIDHKDAQRHAENIWNMRIDDAPVRYGRWIRHGHSDVWKCSACNVYSDSGGNYCPECGAKMDTEGGDASGDTTDNVK